MSVRTATIPLAAVASQRLSGRVYARRRVTAVAVVVLVVLCSVVLARAASVALADRGGDPASAATVRSSVPNAFVPASPTYVAQPGDTLWAIAERFHGDAALDWYVDELVEINGSASIEAGQQITLP